MSGEPDLWRAFRYLGQGVGRRDPRFYLVEGHSPRCPAHATKQRFPQPRWAATPLANLAQLGFHNVRARAFCGLIGQRAQVSGGVHILCSSVEVEMDIILARYIPTHQTLRFAATRSPRTLITSTSSWRSPMIWSLIAFRHAFHRVSGSTGGDRLPALSNRGDPLEIG